MPSQQVHLTRQGTCYFVPARKMELPCLQHRTFFLKFFLLTYNHSHDSGADNRTDKIPNKVLPHIILRNNYYRTSFTLQNKILNTYVYL